MKKSFEFTLEGRDWYALFGPFWLVSVLAAVLQSAARPGSPGSAILYPLGMSLQLAASGVFTIYFLRLALPRLKIGEARLEFSGDVGAYLKILFLGTLLSIVTLGIYLPWFVRRLLSYLSSQTRFAGEKPEFLGNPGKLLLVYLPFLLLILGLVAGVILSGAWNPAGYLAKAGHSWASGGGSPPMPTSWAADGGLRTFLSSMVTFALVLLAYVPLMYLTWRWYVDFSCAGARLHWRTSFWPSCLFILGQTCLTAVTLGIYWPAAALRLYSRFAGQTVLERDGRESGRLGFEGSIGAGFVLLWGQTLLCAVTLGLYIPWGFARVARWLAANTHYEGDAAAAPHP